jgi:hypothetical protein
MMTRGLVVIQQLNDYILMPPEDYVEYRTDWQTLQNHADDMYYMLSDIKNLIEQCKDLL